MDRRDRAHGNLTNAQVNDNQKEITDLYYKTCFIFCGFIKSIMNMILYDFFYNFSAFLPPAHAEH